MTIIFSKYLQCDTMSFIIFFVDDTVSYFRKEVIELPKKTFFHLPKEKQDRLLEAAAIEFSRVPIQDASIANIVKLANIARGSFYQYFEDKEDLYFYYFESLTKHNKDFLFATLKESNGQLFPAMERYFIATLNEIIFGKNADFYRNFFMHMDYRGSRRAAYNENHAGREKRKEAFQSQKQQFIESISLEGLRVENEKQLFWLLQMIFPTFFSSVNEYYRTEKEGKSTSVADLEAKIITQLNWLQYGVSE